MPSSTTSSFSSRKISSSRQSSSCRDSKLLLRTENDFAETASVAPSTSSWSSASTSSRSSSGRKPSASRSASLATSCVSLRDLEHRKNQIELELARVQHELQLRESQRDGRKPSSTVKNGKTGGEMKETLR